MATNRWSTKKLRKGSRRRYPRQKGKEMENMFGIRMNVLEDKEQCSLLKKQLKKGYNIPLSVITSVHEESIEARTCIPTGGKPFDVTKLPPVSSEEWRELFSRLMISEHLKGHEVKWFESTESVLDFIEKHNLSK